MKFKVFWQQLGTRLWRGKGPNEDRSYTERASLGIFIGKAAEQTGNLLPSCPCLLCFKTLVSLFGGRWNIPKLIVVKWIAAHGASCLESQHLVGRGRNRQTFVSLRPAQTIELYNSNRLTLYGVSIMSFCFVFWTRGFSTHPWLS